MLSFVCGLRISKPLLSIYIVNNRVEWEQRGQSIVEEFVVAYGDNMAVEDLLAVSSKGMK